MKKLMLGAGAVFVATLLLDFVIHGVLMGSQYEATKDLWRPDMMDLTWISWVISLIVAVCLSWTFAKGYTGKGIIEGVRFGVIVGLMLSVGMAYGTYMSFAIPYTMALQWFLYGIVKYILLGIVLALVYGKEGDIPPESA